MERLSESELDLLESVLIYEAQEARKRAAECKIHADAYAALTPAQQAEYDKPKPEIVTADGGRIIDVSPHPRIYARLAEIFGEQAAADALRHKLAEAGMVALVAR